MRPASSSHLVVLGWKPNLCPWWRQCGGIVRLEPVTQKVRWHRGGSGNIRLGSQEVSLWRTPRVPPSNPHLCHPVAGRYLAFMGWLASGGLMEGRWYSACSVFTYLMENDKNTACSAIYPLADPSSHRPSHICPSMPPCSSPDTYYSVIINENLQKKGVSSLLCMAFYSSTWL